MLYCTGYTTFDGKFHASKHEAIKHLDKLESRILQKLALEMVRCDVDILPEEARQLVNRCMGGAGKLFERAYMQSYILQHLEDFAKLIEIREDRLIEND